MVIPELIHATYILTAGVSFSCRTLRITVRTNAFIRPNHRECVVRRTTPVIFSPSEDIAFSVRYVRSFALLALGDSG